MRAGTKIFISYAHKDGRDLAERLHADLRGQAWLDTAQLRGGASWSREIERALDESDVVLALLSAGSYASDICRAEQLRSLRKQKCVIPLLAHAGAERPLHLEIQQYRDFSNPSRYTDEFQKLLEDIGARAGASLPERHRQTYVTAPPLPVNYIERPEALEALRRAVIGEDTTRHVALTALRGMGGIGKTILAQALCLDEVIQAAFPDGVIWVTIGQEPRDLVGPMREAAKALGDSIERYDTLDASINQLRTTLRDKAALLVLDDVWQARHVEPFRLDAPRCRVLFTTRDARIAAALGAYDHSLDVLTTEQSLELLARWSDQPLASLPVEAAEVVRECGRLPLALAMIGAMVRGKPGRWANVLHKLRHAGLDKIRQQFPDYPHPNLLRSIQVSVDALEPPTRDRYLDLAVFPEDTPIPEAALEVLWGMNQYDTQDAADEVVDLSLATRSEDRSIKLHDLQLDYVRRQAGEANLPALHQRFLERYAAGCKKGWPSGPNDGYFFQHLAHHLARAGRKPDLRNLLLDFDWLQSKLDATEPNALIGDYEYLADDPEPRLVQDAIRLSAHHLARDKTQLTGQLLGRLSSAGPSGIKAMLQRASEWNGAPWLRPLTGSLSAPGGPLLRILAGHTGWINGVAASADGRYAVSASDDQTLKVWDLERGAEIHSLRGHTGRVNGVTVSADGRRAVSASDDQTLKVWDLERGAEIHTLRGHTHWVLGVAVSGDGRRAVSASGDETMKVWDLEVGEETHTLRGHTGRVLGVAVNSGGRRAVSASWDGTLKLWDLERGAETHTLRGHTGRVLSVAVRADGQRAVSASSDQTLKVWDLERGVETHTLRGHTGEVRGVTVSADGRRAISVSWDQTLKVWDLERGAEMHSLRGHTGRVMGVAVSADGRRAVSASWDHTLKAWDLERGAETHTLRGHTGGVMGVAVSADGRRAVSASRDQTVKVWDVERGAETRTLRGHACRVNGVAVSADGRRAVSASRNQTLKVWNLERGAGMHSLRGHTGRVNGVAVSADGRRAVSASNDHTLKVWDLELGTETHTLRGHTRSVLGVAVSADGRCAVSGSRDQTLRVWDLERGAETHTLRGHTAGVRGVAVSADGRRAVSASNDQTLKVWDVESGRAIATFGGNGALLSCAIGPEGIIVAGDASGAVHFLRLAEPAGEALSGG